jgi:hypothetical protein
VQAGALVKMAHAFNCDTYADPEQWRAEDDLLLQVRHTPPRPAAPADAPAASVGGAPVTMIMAPR